MSAGAAKRAAGRWATLAVGAAVLLAPPVARVALALPFWRSGMTRWDGFLSLSPVTAYLFEEQFKLHILGRIHAMPVPQLSAYATATAELVLPALLVAGLGTRAAAAGLLAMTLVIQLVFPEGWANFHLYWAALALAIVAMGPGPVSLDAGLAALRRRGAGR